MLDSVLSEAKLNKTDITHVAYASGPGAFTGVRIAASTAQGLSIGLGCPMVSVSTLAVLAQQTADIHHVQNIVATIDARMGEAYVGCYQLNSDTQLVHLKDAEKLVKLEQLEASAGYFLAGSGFKAKKECGFEIFSDSLDEEILPHAAALVKLAKFQIENSDLSGEPQVIINYIRNDVAIKKKQQVL